MNNSRTTLLRQSFESAHQWLEGTMEGVTDQVAHWVPPGCAGTLAAEYAHVIAGEDALVNSFVKGGAPLFATSYNAKTGLSELPPMGDWADWGRNLRIDLSTAQTYARAVYANTDAVLAELTDEDLNRMLDLQSIGLGQQPVSGLLVTLIGNVNNHCGEISCLKGLQGLRGYPA